MLDAQTHTLLAFPHLLWVDEILQLNKRKEKSKIIRLFQKNTTKTLFSAHQFIAITAISPFIVLFVIIVRPGISFPHLSLTCIMWRCQLYLLNHNAENPLPSTDRLFFLFRTSTSCCLSGVEGLEMLVDSGSSQLSQYLGEMLIFKLKRVSYIKRNSEDPVFLCHKIKPYYCNRDIF